MISKLGHTFSQMETFEQNNLYWQQPIVYQWGIRAISSTSLVIMGKICLELQWQYTCITFDTFDTTISEMAELGRDTLNIADGLAKCVPTWTLPLADL